MSPRVRYVVGTLALLAVGFGYALSQGRSHPAPPRPIVPAAELGPPAPPPPSARDILDRAAGLDLTAEQRERLEALDSQWKRESAPLTSALESATEKFSRAMDDAQKSGRVRLEDIQERSEDVRELGAALRERRRLHADAAAGVLNESQRQKLRQAGSSEARGGVR